MFLAYIFAFLKNAIYGLSVFFTGSLSDSVDVLDILALRFLMSFGVLFILKQLKIIKVSVKIKELFLISDRRNSIKTLLLTALFEPVLYMLFETLGISMTTGVTAGVILSLMPIASCISESVILKEGTTHLQKLFLALGILGVVYIAINTDTSSGSDSLMGIIFIVLAVAVGSLFLVFSRKSSGHFNAFEVTYASCFVGMVVFNAVNVVRHLAAGDIASYFNPYFNVDNMIGFIFLAVISTIIATSMNNFALGKMQTSTMSAFSGVSTFVTVIVGVVFNNESIYYFHYIGFALILIRMFGVSYISIKREKNKDA